MKNFVTPLKKQVSRISTVCSIRITVPDIGIVIFYAFYERTYSGGVSRNLILF